MQRDKRVSLAAISAPAKERIKELKHEAAAKMDGKGGHADLLVGLQKMLQLIDQYDARIDVLERALNLDINPKNCRLFGK